LFLGHKFQRPSVVDWGLGKFGCCFSHCEHTLANLQSCNYLDKTAQQTDLPDVLTLNC